MTEYLSRQGAALMPDGPAASLLSELLRRLPACVGVYSPDGTCLAANAALGRWLDRPADALVGLGLRQIWPGDFADRQFDRHGEALASGPGGSVQASEEFPSALAWRGVRVVRSVWADRAQVRGVVEIFEEQPGPAGRAETIGRLAVGIAHDVNNALTLVQGHADLVEHALARGDSPSLQELRLAADHACQLPRQLLRYVGGGPADVRRVDLNELLGSIEALIRPRAGEVRVRQELVAGAAWVEGDPVQLTQVFLNLALAALDAMPRGELILRTERRAGAVRVTVADAAAGQEPQPWLFEMPEVARLGGVGLGVIQELVLRHGGRLACESRPGRGTAFVIDLPSRREAGLAAGGGAVVLVVEREPAVRRLTGMILAQAGHEPLLAGDLTAALRQAEAAGRVDLALLDAELAAARAEEELAALIAALPRAKLLYLSTGNVFAPLLPEDRRVVSKPFRAEQLLRAVEAALQGR